MLLHGRLELNDASLDGARAGARRKEATLEVAGLLEAPPGRNGG